MPLPSTTPQDNHATLVVILILTGLCVVYWRTALKLIVILMVALPAYELITTFHI